MQRGGRGDVDVVQIEARRGDHVEPMSGAGGIFLCEGMSRPRRVVVRNVGPIDHVHIHLVKEENVVSQIPTGLSESPLIRAAAHLVVVRAQWRRRAAAPAVVGGVEAGV